MSPTAQYVTLSISHSVILIFFSKTSSTRRNTNTKTETKSKILDKKHSTSIKFRKLYKRKDF